MLFSLEADLGDRVIFYFVPDSYTDIPRVVLYVDGEEALSLAAHEARPSLVAGGRHKTGMCGFSIGPDMLPGIAEANDLSIFDEDTHLLIYRRPRPGQINRRVLYLSASLLPQKAITDNLKNNFQHAATHLEAAGHETVSQLFLMLNMKSVFLAGRILYRNYAQYIEGAFETLFFMDDPWVTLAERILVLGKMRRLANADTILGARDAMVFRTAMEFASDLPLDDDRPLRKALRGLPPEVAPAFVDPVTRLLTAGSPQEMARGGAVASALDVLANCVAVGIRAQADLFADTMAAVLDMPDASLPRPSLNPAIRDLADRLRTLNAGEHLIEKDLELDHFVHKAFAGGR